jgi:predicted Zn-dependent protease
VLSAAVLVYTNCATLQEGLDKVTTVASGAETATKVAKVVRKTFADITEEEEYYIGRTVSALILSKYKVYRNDALTNYVNTVGYAVAIHSDRPETYGGYHFLILDSDEVNALAAPGGFIFITKGLLKRCRDEEMLASILAHEVGHVAAKHGLQSIKKSRLVDAFRLMGQEVSKRYTPQELAQLTSIFEDALGDITEKLIERGYDRKYEHEADKLSVNCMAKTGYDPNGLLQFLETLVKDEPESGGAGWFKTHPSAKDRVGKTKKEINRLGKVPSALAVRTNRFKQATKGL